MPVVQDVDVASFEGRHGQVQQDAAEMAIEFPSDASGSCPVIRGVAQLACDFTPLRTDLRFFGSGGGT